MVIISNTTPVIALSSVNRLDILKSLFKEVIITEEVKAELIAKKRYGIEFPFLDWVKIGIVKNREFLKALSLELGPGEASVIALGKELNADFVIIDEKDGHKRAKYFDLTPIRTLAILEAAKKKGIIETLKPIVLQMVDKGLWYKRELLIRFLKDNDEEWTTMNYK
jgi:predicted nucleic acid-binding protein